MLFDNDQGQGFQKEIDQSYDLLKYGGCCIDRYPRILAYDRRRVQRLYQHQTWTRPHRWGIPPRRKPILHRRRPCGHIRDNVPCLQASPVTDDIHLRWCCSSSVISIRPMACRCKSAPTQQLSVWRPFRCKQ